MKTYYLLLIITFLYGISIYFFQPNSYFLRDWFFYLPILSFATFILGIQAAKYFRNSQKYEGILDFLEEGVVILTPQGIIQNINLKAAQIFNGRKQDFINKALFGLDFLKPQLRMWQKCKKTEIPKSFTFCLNF